MNQKQFLTKIKELQYTFEEIIHFITLGIQSHEAKTKGAKKTNEFYSTEKRKLAWLKRKAK